jgi:DNA-binding CsgD family transcriptional regulator
MPYLFLMIPIEIRRALWLRVSEERQEHWIELRQFLGTVPEGVGRPDETLPRDRLTAREMEILRVLVLGGTLEEIAVSQYVSRNTVKTHVRIIYRKLHVNTRVGAALVMKRFGEQLVESDDHAHDDDEDRPRAIGE